MRQTEPVIEDSGSVEDVHHLRLMALLHELVREKGNRGAASALGIDPRTVASCMKTGRLSWRVREALEQGLQSGAGSAAARQRERNDAVEGRGRGDEGRSRPKRIAAAAQERSEACGRSMQGRCGKSGGWRRSSSRRSEARVEAAPRVGDPGAGTGRGDQVYGDATPVIVEWRR